MGAPGLLAVWLPPAVWLPLPARIFTSRSGVIARSPDPLLPSVTMQ